MTTNSIGRLSAPVAALLLASCGGGGGGGAAPPISTSTPKYGDTMFVTVTGTNLDAGLVVAASGCAPMTRSTTAPNVSDASTAYYSCTVSALGTQSISATRAGESAPMASSTYTVPAPKVRLTVTNGAAVAGTMEFTLAPDKAPITVDNFLRYVRDGFYDNTVFHRVVVNPVPFVIQGGGFRTGPARGLLAPIALEVNKGLSNVQWSVAMARSSDPNSATSQFFVNLADNTAILDPSATSAGYAVFGNVTAGTDLVTAIASAPCAPMTLQSGAVVTAAPECTPNPLMAVTSAVQTQ